MAPLLFRLPRRRNGDGAMSTPGTVVFTDQESDDQLALLDILDHVLNQGVVIRGTLIISLAGVDLVYVGMDVILTSIETAMRHIHPPLTK